MPSGWRNVRSARHRVDYTGPDGTPVAVAYRIDGTAVDALVDGSRPGP